MLPQWSRLETKVDDLVVLLVSLREERASLQAEFAEARLQIVQRNAQRAELRERVDRLLAELEKFEEDARV